MLRILGTLLIMLISVVTANAQTTYRVFQGTTFITAATAPCGTFFPVGDYYTIVYRQKIGAGDPADAMSFVSPRSLFRVLSQDPGGGLQGSVVTSNLYANNRSNFAGSLAGATNLTITSAGGAALNVANALKFVGTVDDFYGNVGCQVTIRAVGVLRPDL